MTIHRLTVEERKNIDVMGWFSVMMHCEREHCNTFFDNGNLKEIQKAMKGDPLLDLYIIYLTVDNERFEVGRFGIRDTGDTKCLTGLVIYKPYRNQGIFKKVIDYLLQDNQPFCLYTSNRFMLASLFNDTRFISNGWLERENTLEIDVKFETVGR